MRKLKLPRKSEPCRHCGGTGYPIDEVPAGEALRAAREAAGLGLREIAGSIGVSPTHVSDVETGRRNPSSAFLGRYLAALGTAQEPPKKLRRP